MVRALTSADALFFSPLSHVVSPEEDFDSWKVLAKKETEVILKLKMSDLSRDEEFNAILGNIIAKALLNRQVLGTLAVAEGSYGVIAYRVGLVPEANSCIITTNVITPPSTNVLQPAGPTSSVDNMGLGETASPTEENVDTSTNDAIETTRMNEEDSLSSILNKKTRLRKQLLQSEHHRTFLQQCMGEGVIPKGLNSTGRSIPSKGRMTSLYRKP